MTMQVLAKMWKNLDSHSLLEGKMVQPFWKIVHQFLIKVDMDLIYNLAIPLLGIHPRKMKIFPINNLYMNVHSSFINGIKHWKQPKYSWTAEWIHTNQKWKGVNSCYTEQHGWISEHAEQKQARHKRVCTVRFYSDEILEKTNLIRRNRKYISSRLRPRVRVENNREGAQGNSWSDEMFCILIVVVITQLQKFSKSHWSILKTGLFYCRYIIPQ